MDNVEQKDNLALVTIISTAIKIPGIRINREAFLRESFHAASSEQKQAIVDNGPVDAGISKSELYKIARKIVYQRTLISTGASFAAGLPGGIAMAATIPADLLQFYAIALRMAQEIAYLYGENDIWVGEIPDSDKVTNQLILYCGVMLSASGAAQAVRLMSSALAKQALKKLPQQALMKNFYYPIVKSIAKFFGARMTKGIFAGGVAKALPVVGGVVSGGITFATLRPMGMRLVNTLEKAHFAYSEAEFKKDWDDVLAAGEREDVIDVDIIDDEPEITSGAIISQIREAKELFDDGILTEDEFSQIKEKLIAQM